MRTIIIGIAAPVAFLILGALSGVAQAGNTCCLRNGQPVQCCHGQGCPCFCFKKNGEWHCPSPDKKP